MTPGGEGNARSAKLNIHLASPWFCLYFFFFATRGSRGGGSLSLPDAGIPDSISGSLLPGDNASVTDKHYNQQAGEVTASAWITAARKMFASRYQRVSRPHLHLALRLFIYLFISASPQRPPSVRTGEGIALHPCQEKGRRCRCRERRRLAGGGVAPIK